MTPTDDCLLVLKGRLVIQLRGPSELIAEPERI
jgi:hypothetical protein